MAAVANEIERGNALRWFRVLQRRSQRTRRSLSWGRMKQIAERYLPYPRILHPWPEQRFLVTIQGKSPVR